MTGKEAANAVMGKEVAPVIPLPPDEPHVAAARRVASLGRSLLGPFAPSIAGKL